MLRINKKLISGILVLLLTFAFVWPTQAREPSSSQERFAVKILELLNNERISRGLNPVTLDFTLCRASKLRANDCSYVDMSNAQSAHTRPDGTNFGTALTEAGVTSWKRALENIAFANGTELSAKQAFQSWMESQGHRDAMLNADITAIGVGYYVFDEQFIVGAETFNGAVFVCINMTVGYTPLDPYSPDDGSTATADSSTDASAQPPVSTDNSAGTTKPKDESAPQKADKTMTYNSYSEPHTGGIPLFHTICRTMNLSM